MKIQHILILAASFTSGFGMVFPFLWALSILGLALFFYLLLERTESRTQAGWYGLFFGLVTGGAGILWFWDALPITFLGISNPAVGLTLVALTWLYVSLSLAVAVALFSVVVWQLRTYIWLPVAIPFLWMITEEGRMLGYTLFTYGSGSLMGAHFSPSSIGYALTESTHLLQLAHPLGLLALNFAAALLAITLVIGYCRRPRRIQITLVTLTVVMLLCPFVVGHRDRGEAQTLVRAAVVATDGSADDRSVGAYQTKELLQATAADPGVELIVLPEVFGYTAMFRNYDTGLLTVREWFGDHDVVIASSERVPSGDGFIEQLVYTSTQSGRLTAYTKRLLIPLGEYFPSFASVLYAFITDSDVREYFSGLQSYGLTPGTDVVPVTYGNITIGGLLCSDLLSPHLYHTLATRDRATILVSLSNQYWFHGSRILFDKTLQMARVRAVQEHVPFLLANNGAPSFILDPSGEVVSMSHWHTPEVLIQDIPVRIPTP